MEIGDTLGSGETRSWAPLGPTNKIGNSVARGIRDERGGPWTSFGWSAGRYRIAALGLTTQCVAALVLRGPFLPVRVPGNSRTERKGTMNGTESLDLLFPGAVLLVDDNDVARSTIARILEGRGVKVLQAANGAEAVDVFRKRHGEICLVLLDLKMPVMDGFEALVKIKEIDSEVLVLIWTAEGTKEEEKRLLSDGAIGLLRKPVSPDVVIDEMKKALRNKVSKNTRS